MHPAVRATLFTAALAALGGVAPARTAFRVISPPAPPAGQPSAEVALPSFCAKGTLPDGESCVPFGRGPEAGGPELEATRNQHHDRRGQLQTYDQIPRRPDRPASYAAFVYPIATPDGGPRLLSGYDLDREDDQQRRGPGLRAVGHGGVDLSAPRGAEVRAVALENQQGDAEILYVGALFGTSVVTRHTLREGGRLREYLLIHGHLDRAAEGLARGARVGAGELLGYVGDTGSVGVVHLHLEARRARDGVDPHKLAPGRLADSAETVVVDPRNVLALRPAP